MVYKKFGNKIPSLSSLLLAGVLLGSNCGKEKKDTAGEQTTNNKEQDAKEGEAKNSGAKTIHNKAFIEADKAIKNILLAASYLSYLSQANDADGVPLRKPYVLPNTAVNSTDDQEVLSMTKRLVTSFSSKFNDNISPYPQGTEVANMQNSLSALASLSDSNIKQRPRAYAKALNEIASFCYDLHKASVSMWEKVEQGCGDNTVHQLAESTFSPLLSRLAVSQTRFKHSQPFSDVPDSESKLLTNSQLGRFLNNFTKSGNARNGSPGQKIYDVPKILKETFDVWIKSKDKNVPCVINTKLSTDYIDQRGSGLGEGPDLDKMLSLKKDKRGQGWLPYVPALPNNTLEHRYNKDLHMKYIKSEQNDLSNVFTPESSQTGRDGITKSHITFATLLFTLFRGSEECDFLTLEGKKNGEITLTGINNNFQELVSKNLSDDQFAKKLHAHITNLKTGLSHLFVIPDLQTLYAPILLPTTLRKDEVVSEDTLKPSFIAMLAKFNVTCENETLSEVFEKIKKLAELYDQTHNSSLESSDADIAERFYIFLAHEMVNDSVISSLKVTRDQFESLITTCGNDFSDMAVVRIGENGVPSATSVTTKIRKHLDDINQLLINKYNDTQITYADINKNATGFTVEAIRDGYEKTCQGLKSVFKIPIYSLLEKQESLIKDDFRPISGLDDHDLVKINRIKESYKAQQAAKK